MSVNDESDKCFIHKIFKLGKCNLDKSFCCIMKIITDYLREEITFCKINNNKMFYKKNFFNMQTK